MRAMQSFYFKWVQEDGFTLNEYIKVVLFLINIDFF